MGYENYCIDLYQVTVFRSDVALTMDNHKNGVTPPYVKENNFPSV